MNINAISTIPTDAAASASSGGSALGKEEFLQLLVAQLSNQDPMNPLEGQEFAAQLAQFSSVEALLNIEGALSENAELSALIAQSTNSGVAAGLIGKSVTAQGNAVDWSGDGESVINYDIESNAATVTVEIKNDAGVVIRTLELTGQESGANTAAWDGKTDAGDVAEKGSYTFSVKAVDSDGADVAAATHTKGIVDRVSFTPDGIVLWMGETPVSMSAVTSVSQ